MPKFDMNKYVRCPGSAPKTPKDIRGDAEECRAQYCMPDKACIGIFCPNIMATVESLSDICGVPDGRPKITPCRRPTERMYNSGLHD